MLTLSQLYVYPIKSLGGIALDRATVTDRGLAHDRRYLLVDREGQFLTIRQHPQLTLLQPRLTDDGLEVAHRDRPADTLPLTHEHYQDRWREVTIWNNSVRARPVSAAADAWFSRQLGLDCALVYMPDESFRPITPSSGLRPPGPTSFADAYPFLLIGEASLADLNSRSKEEEHFIMLRFRPNLVFRGGAPYVEDTLEEFRIGGIHFTAVEPCARCGVPTVDPLTAEAHPARQPLATLAQYRCADRKINFGMNLVHRGGGELRVGDVIQVEGLRPGHGR